MDKKLKQIWIIWSIVTVLLVVSFVIGIIDYTKTNTWHDFVDKLRSKNLADKATSNGETITAVDKDGKFWKTASDTNSWSGIVGLVISIIPVALAGLVHSMFFASHKNKKSISGVVFIIVLVLMVLGLIFGVWGLFSDKSSGYLFHDFKVDGDALSMKTQIVNKHNDLGFKTLGIISVVLSVFKVALIGFSLYGVKQLFPKSSR